MKIHIKRIISVMLVLLIVFQTGRINTFAYTGKPNLYIYIYANETDNDIIELSHSTKVWIPFGKYTISDNLYEEIKQTGVTDSLREKKVAASEFVYGNSEIQGFINNTGLNYSNYRWRFVREPDGIHLDGVIMKSSFPQTDKNDPINQDAVLPKLLTFIYAVETDEDILKLSHNPNMWLYFGEDKLDSNLYKAIIDTGLTVSGETKTIRATEFIMGNNDIKELISDNTTLSPDNYDWRLVYESDGIHLDGVLRQNNYPNNGSDVNDSIDVTDEVEDKKEEEEGNIPEIPENTEKPDNTEETNTENPIETPDTETKEETTEEIAGSDIKFAIDGIYNEWTDYPHTLLEYNSWDNYDDAMSAIYKGTENTFFHCYTEMPEHLKLNGTELATGITVIYNDNYSFAFYPRFIQVDNDGNINWNPSLESLAPGIHHFYITGTDAWATSTNINNLNEADTIYGDAYIEITDTKNQIEWKLDTEKLAKKFGIDKNELQTVKVKYDRLGQQWTIVAGTSTGIELGIIICLVVVLSSFAIKFLVRKEKK